MSIWGKIIGGAAGLFMGGPLGALLGVAAGHAYDKMKGGEGGPRLSGGSFGAAQKQAAFTIAVVALSAKMAKADGHVSREEIDTFKTIFRIPEDQMGSVGRLFDQAKRSTDGYEVYARQVAELFEDSPEVLETLLDALFMIALADGVLHPSEKEFLENVAEIFGMPHKDFERVRAEHATPGLADPYQVLGVERSAEDAEIKSAFRKLLKEHHPDALIAKGVPEEVVEASSQKMASINAAYDQIKKERGLT